MQEKYGLLLTPDIKLHRKYFTEMVKLLGIQVLYLAPRKDKTYTPQSELISNYDECEKVGCIFTEHPNQQTLRKIGWAAELQEGSSIIHVPYDLHDLQQGALFYIPGGLDDSSYRLFRVVKLTNIAVYPASIACEIVPEYENVSPPDAINDFSTRNFTLINPESD